MIAERPLPRPDDATEPYWQGCREHELRMQCCTPCARLRFPPRPMCPRCQSFESGWVRVSGRGTVYSWVVCHPPLLPAFEPKAPLLILLVELEEGENLRVVGNWMDEREDADARASGHGIEIGMPVEVAFERVSDDVTLPQWRPRS